MSEYSIFTSESVSEGHPDKMADQISDAILDAIMANNEGANLASARVACETAVKTKDVVLLGEITSAFQPDYEALVRRTIQEIGYDSEDTGIDPNTCRILNFVEKQSPDIAQGTTEANLGAGDQGMMFGFAANETPGLMPLPIDLAHGLCRRLAEVRKSGLLPHLRPDGKAQVTVVYDNLKPVAVTRVVVATQHTEESTDRIPADVLEQVVKPVMGDWLTDEVQVLINGTGRFVVGGPKGDAGLTGRKIIVDTYGGIGRHGGGAFSGKDPTKVDRSAAYFARYIAKNVVAAGLAERCEFHLAYCIGVAEPQAVGVETFGTGKVDDEQLAKAITEVFDCRPAAIIDALGLRRPIYRPTAAYGHFGRTDLDLPWERTDRVDELLRAAGAKAAVAK
ncbi:MAG: methionine adenosyltransferase [Armatimonadetes bacterium]|nr:methionine adenosyltransferase [Armatimonadota bacterium]